MRYFPFWQHSNFEGPLVRVRSLPLNFNSVKMIRSLLIILAVYLLFFWFSGLIVRVHGSSVGLEGLPSPFVSSGGLLNCSVVVASSVGHGPCGGAHTMDVMGAIMVGGKFGLKADGGMLDATMDDYVSTYDFGAARVELGDVSSNLVVVGGPGVNQVTWYYNNLRNGTSARVLPVYFDKDESGADYICVASSGHSYSIERDGSGRVSADYGVVLMLPDEGRFVLILAGLGGSGTWASCKVVSSFESWSLRGSAVIIKFYDSDGDGLLDALTIVEEVSGVQYASSDLGSVFFGVISSCSVLKWKVLKQKIARRRRWFKAYVLLFLTVASQIVLLTFSSVPDSEVYTLRDFSKPFVSSGGLLNCSVVVASSVGHGPCGGAHTMDVMGAIMVAAQLGLDAVGGVPSSTLDDHISSYDTSTANVSFPSLGSNLLVVGGPGVNQVTWYYNNLRNASGARVLPVYFDKDESGADYICVASSGHSYSIERDGSGSVKADYGFVTLFYDAQRGVWVLIVAGLGGPATLAASRLLANYKSWSLFGRASVVKFADSNGDGYLDEVSVAESVGFGKNIDVYWDNKCLNRVESIDWGMLAPGETKNVMVYARNEGENGAVLTLNVYGWNPVEASNYLRVEWNYTGAVIKPGETMAIILILTVDLAVKVITNFSVTIEVNSS